MFLNNINFYSDVKALKLVSDKIPSGASDDVEFSRIYGLNPNKSSTDCRHISGRMAHRLYLQGIMETDQILPEFGEYKFVDLLFRDYNDKSNIYIKQSYIDFMLTSQTFQQLIKHALNRILCRLIKGCGFKCNCIAEQVLSYHIIVMAQDALVERTEMDHFQIEGKFDDNSWHFERKKEKLDVNFLLVLQKELSVNINQSLNNVRDNTYKYVTESLERQYEIREQFEKNRDISKKEFYGNESSDNDGIDRRMTPTQYVAMWFNKAKDKMDVLNKYERYLIDHDNPKIGIISLIKKWKLNKIHPEKWFVPFDRRMLFDFYWNDDDWKRVKVRKRCIVCKKRNNKSKCIKLKKCNKCKSPFYCNRKCQKVHWKHKHNTECAYWCDIDKLGWEKANEKHFGINYDFLRNKQ
eukprot:70988_1